MVPPRRDAQQGSLPRAADTAQHAMLPNQSPRAACSARPELRLAVTIDFSGSSMLAVQPGRLSPPSLRTLDSAWCFCSRGLIARLSGARLQRRPPTNHNQKALWASPAHL